MRFRVLSAIAVMAIVFAAVVPVFAFSGGLDAGLVNQSLVQDGLGLLKNQVTDQLPVFSKWFDTLVLFFKTYLGDVMNWLP